MRKLQGHSADNVECRCQHYDEAGDPDYKEHPDCPVTRKNKKGGALSFVQGVYASSSPETRRRMNQSYVESGGSVLSTDPITDNVISSPASISGPPSSAHGRNGRDSSESHAGGWPGPGHGRQTHVIDQNVPAKGKEPALGGVGSGLGLDERMEICDSMLEDPTRLGRFDLREFEGQGGWKRKGREEQEKGGCGEGGWGRRTKTRRADGEREAGGAGGAGRGPAMRNNAGETADAASSSDDAFVKQAARQLLEQVLAYHTSKEKSQVLSDSRYRSILFSLLPQSGVEVPSQDLQEFPLSRNDQKNQISAKKPTAKKDATGYEYKGERYVVRSLKGEIMLPASMIFEVLFRMYKGGARTKERLHDMVKSSQYDQTSLPGIVIDDFMRVMRMCDQDLPPLEMKYSNYFRNQKDSLFLAKFSKLKLAGVNMGTDDAVRLATILSTNFEQGAFEQAAGARAAK